MPNGRELLCIHCHTGIKHLEISLYLFPLPVFTYVFTYYILLLKFKNSNLLQHTKMN